MSGDDKPLVWLHGEARTPPIGSRCHELRIPDGKASWRNFYRIDEDAILILGVEAKKTRTTPQQTIEACRPRLRAYDQL